MAGPEPFADPQAARSWFERLRALPESERGAALQELRATKPELGQEVASLLEADDSSELALPSWMGQSWSVSRFAAHCLLGEYELGRELLDRYAIRSVLGAGASSIVYRARRLPSGLQVALKILRPSGDAAHWSERFQVEAAILKELDHPSIAQIVDAGEVQTGRGPMPFIATSFIDGPTLSEYARQPDVDDRKKVLIAAELAEALQHAHERGVLHQDIKPANAIVDALGRPVLIDFGLASTQGAMDSLQGKGEAPHQTFGTWPYMSPERVLGTGSASVRSEVYELGATLYRLLTGHPPIDLAGLDPEEARRRMKVRDAAPLSRWRRDLAGDLEWILAKALDRRPERRFASAGAFAAELLRWARSEPVWTLPPRWHARCRRFVREHRMISAAMAAIVVTLTAATAITAFALDHVAALREAEASARAVAEERLHEADAERERAQTSAEEAENAHRNLLGLLTRIQGRRDPVEMFEEAVKLATASKHTSPAYRAEILEAVASSMWWLGEVERAREIFELAAEQQLAAFGPNAPELIATRIEIASLELAFGLREDALRSFERLLNPEFVGRLTTGLRVRAHIGSSMAHAAIQRFDESEHHARQALELISPEIRDADIYRVQALGQLARLMQLRGQVAEAERHYLEAWRVAEVSALTEDTRVLGVCMNHAALLADSGRVAEALLHFEHVYKIRSEWYGAEHLETLQSRHNFAAALQRVGRLDEAIEHLEATLFGRVMTLGAEHPVTINTRLVLASAYWRIGRNADAEEEYRRVFADARKHLGRDEPIVGSYLLHFADYLEHRERHTEARKALLQAISIYDRRVGAKHPHAQRARNRLYEFDLRAGQPICLPGIR